MIVKGLNGTLGPEGLLSSASVFGKYIQVRAPEIGQPLRSDLDEASETIESA